jgi:hypothetical protein
MARKFLTPIDLNKNELQNAVIQNLGTAPSSPVKGQIYFDTVENELFTWNGVAWNQATGTSIGLLSARPAAASSNTGTFYYATDNYLVYYSNGSTWQQTHAFGSGSSSALTIAGTASDGSLTNYARADHVHAGPGFGAPTSTTTYGQSAATGTALTVSHSDHTHGTVSLSTNAASTITATSSTNGSGTTPAKDDHVHGFTPSGFALSAFGVPTSAVAFNSQKITGLADPTSAQDAATKNYVDTTAQGLNIHNSADVATTVSLTTNWTYNAGSAGTDGGTGVGATLVYSAAGTFVIDTVTLTQGMRVLVKNQATQLQNGIYTVGVVGGSTLTLTRATDYDNGTVAGEVVAGDFIYVAGGGQAGTGWVESNQGTSTNPVKGIKVGTDAIAFTQFSGAGTILGGNGITVSGLTVNFAPSTTGGLQAASTGATAAIKLATTSGLTTDSTGLYVTAGLGVTISGAGAAGAATTNQVAINTDVVVRKYATAIGDGTSTSITVTHNLNTRDVTVGVYSAASTYDEVSCDVQHTTVNTVTLLFSVAPTSNQYRAVVHG